MREGLVLGMYLENVHTHYQDCESPELIINAVNFVRVTLLNARNSDEASGMLRTCATIALNNENIPGNEILNTSANIIDYVDCN